MDKYPFFNLVEGARCRILGLAYANSRSSLYFVEDEDGNQYTCWDDELEEA